MAFSPDRQTLFTVNAGTVIGMPALTAACRAVICPAPAWITWPMITWSTWSPEIPAFSRAPLIAIPPSSIAVNDFNEPDSFPIGVRAPPTITEPGMTTTSSDCFERRILRPPHRLVHLLHRVVQRRLRQALLLGGAGHGDGDGGRDHPQVGHRRQQARPAGGGVRQPGHRLGRGGDHAVGDPRGPGHGHAEAEAGEH